MSWMLRLALGLVLAGGLTAVLWASLGSGESTAGSGTASSPPWTPAAVADVPQGRPWMVYLVHSRRSPAKLRPLVEIIPDGSVRVHRDPPPVEEPEAGAPWLAAGVILPSGELGLLNAVQRAALRAVLSRWSVRRPLQPDQIVAWGVRFRPTELSGLLRWVR